MNDKKLKAKKYGKIAKKYTGQDLELQVLKSRMGYYIGTINERGPVSRESLEYWSTFDLAETALIEQDDDNSEWTQIITP